MPPDMAAQPDAANKVLSLAFFGTLSSGKFSMKLPVVAKTTKGIKV